MSLHLIHTHICTLLHSAPTDSNMFTRMFANLSEERHVAFSLKFKVYLCGPALTCCFLAFFGHFLYFWTHLSVAHRAVQTTVFCEYLFGLSSGTLSIMPTSKLHMAKDTRTYLFKVHLIIILPETSECFPKTKGGSSIWKQTKLA